MPTLLESFSGTYVEAMYHNKPIFTSDLDFAKAVCKEGAFYFNPFDEKDILETINYAYSDKKIIEEKINIAHNNLKSFSTWEQVFGKIQTLLDELN